MRGRLVGLHGTIVTGRSLVPVGSGDGRFGRAGQVIHKTGTHGQRYKEDRSKKRRLPDLVKTGAERIAAWASAHNFEDAAAEIRRDRRDGRSARRENSRSIP